MRGPYPHHPVFSEDVLQQAHRWLHSFRFADRFRNAHMKPEWIAAEQVLNMEEFEVYGSPVSDTFIAFHLMDMIDETDEESYEYGCFVYKLWQYMQETRTIDLMV